MKLPFDGAISAYLNDDAPNSVRDVLLDPNASSVLDKSYPYRAKMSKKAYRKAIAALHVELVKFQSWVQSSGVRVALVFEGRDAAGKGGSIKAITENLNPRVTRVVALSKPTEKEQGEWYFQRYISYLPTAGNITLFDRSWYNRSVVERVFGFCSEQQVRDFNAQVPDFERMLVEDGLHLVKFWLNVSRAEQLKRFLKRESDPLKQWKLSSIDVKGLALWEGYSASIRDMFEATDHAAAPWVVVRSDDKKRARLAIIRHIWEQFDYDYKDHKAIGDIDPLILAGPDIWNG